MVECVFTGIVAAATGTRTYVFSTVVGSTCTSLGQHQHAGYVTVEMEEVRMYESNGSTMSEEKKQNKQRQEQRHRQKQTGGS